MKRNFDLCVRTPNYGTLSETFIARHISDLDPRGASVICDTLSVQTEFRDRSNTFVRCDRDNWINKRLRERLPVWLPIPVGSSEVQFLKKTGCKVILAEYMDSSLDIIEVSKKAGIPMFVHAHGYDVSAALRLVDNKKSYLRYNSIAGIVTMSEYSKATLVDIGLAEERIHVIPYGVDVPEAPPHRKRGGVFHIIAIGRLVGKKAPILLLDSFRRALQKTGSIHLTIVGDGPLKASVQQYIMCNQLGASVTLRGACSHEETLSLLRSSDLFVQHSVVDPVTGDMEGLPLSILEAMAQGLPVVSTKHAGIPEAVIDGKTGFLVEEGDVQAMSELIVTAALDEGLCTAAGEAAHHRIKTKFSWSRERQSLRTLLGLS